MINTDKKKPINPRGSGITRFVTDSEEDRWLKENIIPKLHKSE